MICWNDGATRGPWSGTWQSCWWISCRRSKGHRPMETTVGLSFFLLSLGSTQLDGVRVLMHCCAKHLRHDTKGIRFLTLHMCFFHVRVGTTSLCWSLFSGWPHLRRILFARLDVPWTTGSHESKGSWRRVEDSEGCVENSFFLWKTLKNITINGNR